MRAEEIMALMEAIEEIGDDDVVLTTVMALREPEFREEVERLLVSSPTTRQARGVFAPSRGRGGGAANG